MGYTALPTKNPGDVLTSALWNTYLQGNADTGFMRMLADSTLGASAASFDFTSIPATFAHLMLVAYLRYDVAATSGQAKARLNNDSAGDYYYNFSNIGGGGGTVTATASLADTSGAIGLIPGASAPANHFATVKLLIPHYGGSANHKAWAFESFCRYNNTGVGANDVSSENGGCHWAAAAAAINRLTLLPPSGNFVAGSRATLYGLPV